MLGWPEKETYLELGSVKSTNSTKIQILNHEQDLQFQDIGYDLIVTLPSFYEVFKNCNACQWGTVLKMTDVEPRSRRSIPNIEIV